MELKLTYNDIEQTLTQLADSANTLEPNIRQKVFGLNQLDTEAKLDELNNLLQGMLQSYQQLLIKNEMAVRQSVHLIEESDASLAGGIKMSKR